MRVPGNSVSVSRSISNLEAIPKQNTLTTLSEKIKHTSNSSKEFCRTLDKYGIDINPTKIQDNRNINSVTVFAHKDLQGNYKLETGLYISNPKSGDTYGDFKFYQGRGAKKYQTPQVAKLEFDKSSLNQLKDTYHKVSGITSFLRDVLELRTCKDLAVFQNSPELFSYLPPQDEYSNGFLTYPNLPYIDPNSLLEDLTLLKDKREGIALCAYAIHPNQNLSLIEHIQGVDSLDNANKEAKTFDNTRTLYEIESGTNVKYLSSILDLDINDVPTLESLREHMIKHLTEIYKIDQSTDKVQLFFHFPVAEETATLHLHARVNKADHPLNEARSFALSEVINTLRNGESINDMILERNNGVYYTGINESVAAIKDIPNKGATDNPHVLTLSHPFERSATPLNS